MDSNPDIVTFICPHCQGKNLVSGKWFDANTTLPCVFCQQGVNLDDIDLEDDGDNTVDIDFDPAYYLAPVLACAHCRSEIQLFCSPLPETDEAGVRLVQGENPPEMPPDGWSALFGCLGCGSVSEYVAVQANVKTLLKLSRGQYQSGTGLYRVEFPCADKTCKRPFTMYVDMGNVAPSAVIPELRQAHFHHTLPCGHLLMPVPDKYYSVYPVVHRMW
jgi:hypothetical protein